MELYRASAWAVPPITGNSSSPPEPPNPFDNSAGTLLGGCTNAAFAADLWTHATATDGYGQQTQYDRFHTLAFALIAPCPPCPPCPPWLERLQQSAEQGALR